MQDSEKASAEESAKNPAAPAPRTTWRCRWLLLLACATGTALRVAYVCAMRADPFFFEPILDAAYHLRWAEASAAGESFVRGPYFRAPGYPEFLALCLRAAPTFLEPLTFVRLVQAILGGCATVGLVWRITRLVYPGSRTAPFFSAMLAALAWPLVAYDGELLLPALAVPLNLLALERTLATPSSRRPLFTAAQAGVVFALAALVRPNVLLFVPFAGFWLYRTVGGERKGKLLPAGALILCTLLALLPVTLRNAQASKAEGLGSDFVLVSAQAGLNLWIGNHPGSDGMSAVAPGLPAGLESMISGARVEAEQALGDSARASDISRHFIHRALQATTDNPALTLRRFLWKWRLFWSSAEPTNTRPLRFFGERFAPLATRIAFLRFGALLMLGLAGAVFARRLAHPRAPARLLVAFLLIYSLSVTLFFVTERFRVPVVPVLCVFGGGLLSVVGCGLGRRATGAERRAAGLAGLATAVVGALLFLTSPKALPQALGGATLQNPQAAGVWLLAQRLGERGRTGDAETGYREALALRSDLWIAHRDLGVSLAQNLPRTPERQREARQHLETAARLFPGLETFPPLVSLELSEGRIEAARAVAEELTRVSPAFAAGPYQLGRIAAQMGDRNAALASFEEALEREPHNFDAAFGRARMIQDLAGGAGQTERALDAWQLAVLLADESNQGVPPQWAWAAREAWLVMLCSLGQDDAAEAYLGNTWSEGDRARAIALRNRLGL